jgi:cytochrome d ubiquinol oxidase subunit II
MHLYDLPVIFVLIGLALYVVLAGADFGAGIWQLLVGRGPDGQRLRDHAHHSMAPVWEANHVWLIFVLTVLWTAYPVAFGSIASTLSIPLFLAALGIILRGAAYALRAGTDTPQERRTVDDVFAVSSILAPFALGTAAGGIASGRVPVGNAAGHLFSSWLNPTSVLIGVLSVSVSAYLAAVYLSADAVRLGDPWLERRFRVRALIAGAIAGAVAIAGLIVLHGDAHPLYHRLVDGTGVVALIASTLAGTGTLALVARRRYEPARYTAALAVAAIIVGWALAQQPALLPGLTVAQAAAPHDTLVLVTIAVLAGAVILFPSLGFLFRLVLGGQFDPSAGNAAEIAPAPVARGSDVLRPSVTGLLARTAGAALIAGIGLLNVADSSWAHAIGVVALLAFIVLGFGAARPAEIAAAGAAGAAAAAGAAGAAGADDQPA